MLNKKNKLIYIGAALLLSGFIILSLVDRMALNPAGFIAPVLFVAGWTVIIRGCK